MRHFLAERQYPLPKLELCFGDYLGVDVEVSQRGCGDRLARRSRCPQSGGTKVKQKSELIVVAEFAGEAHTSAPKLKVVRLDRGARISGVVTLQVSERLEKKFLVSTLHEEVIAVPAGLQRRSWFVFLGYLSQAGWRGAARRWRRGSAGDFRRRNLSRGDAEPLLKRLDLLALAVEFGALPRQLFGLRTQHLLQLLQLRFKG